MARSFLAAGPLPAAHLLHERAHANSTPTGEDIGRQPSGGLAREATLAGVQLPEAVVGLFFPAQRYMQQRASERRREFRGRVGLPVPEGVEPGDEREAARRQMPERVRAQRDHRLATIAAIESEQGELLRSAAGKLERTGAAQLTTAAGMISARITRFRWGDDVIEVTRTCGTGRCRWSLGRLPRSPGPIRDAEMTRSLAQALAALEPGPA
jgi:hypothetical protein